jgi:hypothetical protein
MIILVTGDRDWKDDKFIWEVLDKFKDKHYPHLMIVQGMCKGVDYHAYQWARTRTVDYASFYAHWDYYGKSAGPIRNRHQFDTMNPDLVLAFHPDIINGSVGTYHQVTCARNKKTKVMILTGKEDLCELSVP